MGIPDISSVQPLAGPFEILDLGDMGVKELVITSYVIGRMRIQPRTGMPAKDIVALRVYVPVEIKPLFPDWYDITGQTLIAQMLPVLEKGGYQKKRFKIQKFGSGPEARFGVTVT